MIPSKFSNPLDSLFDIEAGDRDEMQEYVSTTENEITAQAPAVVEKDQEDIDTDRKIDEVYDTALNSFQELVAYTQIIEPRYAARNAEVAATYLSLALQAATSKAKLKTDRKRVATFIPGGNKVTNNTVVCSREEIMRMISVDAEVKKI